MRIENTQQNQHGGSAVHNRAELGKDEFMNILVAQLRFQNPLRPMDDREFISQMAQFSALEQMQNLNREFTNVKALDLIGSFVSARIDREGQEPELIHGLAESVTFTDGRTHVIVGGQSVALEDIMSVHMMPNLDPGDIQSDE